MNISEISIKRPTIPLVILIITLLSGIYFGGQLKYELIPDISTSVIVVTTVYPGAGPDEIEKSVTIPLEDALARLEGVDEVISTSMEGVSVIKLMMDYNTNPATALQDAKNKVDREFQKLPEDARVPSVSKVDLSELPIITMGAFSNLSDADFFDLVDLEIQPALSQIAGVANVGVLGGMEREIKVNLKEGKLEAFNLSLKQVVRMIGAANVGLPAGKLQTEEREISIRLAGKYNSLQQLRKTVIGYTSGGDAILLAEVADVFEGTKEITTIARINSDNAISFDISKQKEANAVEVSKEVQAKIKALESEFKRDGLRFIVASDSSVFTLNAARAVGTDLVLAIILVSLIMLLFLKSYRNTLFVLVTIPTSLIATFIVMYLFDFSLNLISLSSLSLVVGSVVDDAIVIIENIHRHMEMGKKRLQATIDSMREIGLTLVSTTAVLGAVFIPIALVSGITGQILREYAITIVAAMLFSLLFTFTLVPLLTYRFARIEKPGNNKLGEILEWFEKQLELLATWVTGILKWVLNHKLITTILVMIAFGLSMALIPAGFIGTSFMDAGDRGNALIRIEFPKDIPIGKNAGITSKVEQIIMKRPEVDVVYTTIGKRTGGVISSSGSTPYFTEFNVVFFPVKKRDLSSLQLSRLIRKEVEEEIPGIKVSAANVNMMGNEEVPIKIYLKGNNPDSVFKAAHHAADLLLKVQGTTEVENSMDLGNPELLIKFNRDKMAWYGITVSEAASTIRTAFAGNTDHKFRSGEREYDINIKYDDFYRDDKSDLESLVFSSPKGNIKLNQFAEIVHGNGPVALERYGRGASATVSCQLVGISQGQAQAEFEKLISQKPLPQGTYFEYSGKTKMMSDSFASLGLAFVAAIIFMYLIMVLLYNNWLHPFVVLFTIPLAIIGALFALALANENLSLFTILGIIMLSGLVAKNAILVIDFANELQLAGKKLNDAILEAVQLRFRAILMTNISMIIGLIPLAVSAGAGAEWKNGIGWVLIGGLTVSMFLSMVIVPMIYYVFEKSFKPKAS